MESNFTKICRICLEGKGVLTSLFTDEVISPSIMIMMCTTVKLMENDGLPNVICNNCVYRLRISFQFKRQCENSDDHLRQCLGIVNKEESKILKKTCETSLDKDFGDPVKDEDIYNAVNVVCEMFADQEHNLDDSHMHNDDNHSDTELKIITVDEKLTKIENTVTDNKMKDSNSKKWTYFGDQSSNGGRRSMVKRLSKAKSQLKRPEKCLDCGKTFIYSRYLEAHIRTHTGEKPYECNICNKKFTQTGNLALHMRTHTGEKPFQCEVCSKQFTTSSNLHAHQKIHTQVRNYPCTQCSRAFKTSSDLTSHIGTHTGIKNHICKICGKAFYKTSYLNVHTNTVHKKERKHKCSECGKEFSNSSNLTCHFRIHTGEKPFSCKFCDASFNQWSALQRHRKQHQPNEKKKSSRQSNSQHSAVSQINNVLTDSPLAHVSGGSSTSPDYSKNILVLYPPCKTEDAALLDYTKAHNMTLSVNDRFPKVQTNYMFTL